MNDAHALRQIAILIDGDNAESSALRAYLAEASKHGRVTTKRIYGDWTSPHMNKWKNYLNTTAFRPIQKFAYTKNKNSTDTALIIDAMDMLHLGSADGFCIVSSDSDYTGLCHRVREHGKFVMVRQIMRHTYNIVSLSCGIRQGIGRSFTPEAFVSACEVFVFYDNLSPIPTPPSTHIPPMLMISDAVDKIVTEAPRVVTITPPRAPRLVCDLTTMPLACIDTAYTLTCADDNTDGVPFAALSNNIRKVHPLFDHRHYGFTSFKQFCEALAPRYETKGVIRPDGRPSYVLLRIATMDDNHTAANARSSSDSPEKRNIKRRILYAEPAYFVLEDGHCF